MVAQAAVGSALAGPVAGCVLEAGHRSGSSRHESDAVGGTLTTATEGRGHEKSGLSGGDEREVSDEAFKSGGPAVAPAADLVAFQTDLERDVLVAETVEGQEDDGGALLEFAETVGASRSVRRISCCCSVMVIW